MMLHTAESAAQPERAIAEGDLVVVYQGFDSMKAVRVEARAQFQNKFGCFDHKEWLGKPFGSKAVARGGEGWVLLLAPTPELWTEVLRHRTQILYLADIAMVCAMLELRPGATVLECGTGSGSLTTSLARAVAPTGHVHTFEFHEQRAQLAAEEFKVNGLGGLVTVTHRNIESDGFPAALHGLADGLFLDLPKPHLVVPSAAACVRPDGMFCSFSPCIEQVQRTAEMLNAHGFRDIRTMEILLRQHEVSRQALLMDMEAPPPGPGAGKKHQQRRQQELAGGRDAKRQRTDGQGAAEPAAAAAADGSSAPAAAEGTAAAAAEGTAEDAGAASPGSQQQQQQQGGEVAAPSAADAPSSQRQAGPPQAQVVARPVPFGRGHTGYLTFARRVVNF